MSETRVLVGTAKGGFVLRSDGDRHDWKLEGPHFAGWETFHLAGSPVDPDLVYASQAGGWFGQVIQRSTDGGRSFEPVGNDLRYAGVPGTHQFYDGTAVPWEFSKVWHLSPSLHEREVVYAGVQDAALFRSDDAGLTWRELSGLREHGTGSAWQPGAGGLCLHTIVQDPRTPDRLTVAISAAGVFRSDDGGETWRPRNVGLSSEGVLPDPDADVGHCVHKLAAHPHAPDTVFMQKHWDVMRSDDAGDGWREISGDLPSDFGFAIAVHAHQPETVYVVPITSDSLHYPPDGALRVYRTRAGGGTWEPLTEGLPQEHCYHDVLRDALAVDAHDPCGLYLGTTGGQIYASHDEGDTWTAIASDLPRVLSVEVQTLP